MKVEMEVLQEFTLPIKRVRFAIEVDAAQVGVAEALIASTWKMKGFRTGIAPVGIIKARDAKKFDGAVRQRIVHETMERELTERYLEPFSSPRLIFIEPKETGAIAFLVIMDATERKEAPEPAKEPEKVDSIREIHGLPQVPPSDGLDTMNCCFSGDDYGKD